MEGLQDDLDVLLVGAYFGKRNPGQVSTFMCAILNNSADLEPKFLSFCKIGSGYSFEQLAEIRNRILPFAKPFNPSNCPTWFSLAPPSREKPDLIISNYNDCPVITVKATQIVESTQYACGYTLRFPRFVGIREDKKYVDCMTLSEMNHLRQLAEGRLALKSLQDYSSLGGMKRKRKTVKKPTVSSLYVSADVKDVKQVGSFFSNKEFCVSHGDEKTEKNQLEILIAKFGGSLTQNPSSNTFCIISGKPNGLKEKSFIVDGRFNIARIDWVFKCIEEKRLIPFKPSFMIFANKETLQSFRNLVDCYGDSYTEPVTVEEFKELISKIDISKLSYNVEETVKEFKNRYLNKFE
ncbi:Nucleic acid-binding domain-containing protein [Rozella allomycis CSF55]|uniref:Nucleic acid-binding domain-containing protein n=1 Tax=Rozella allomycis (strain CSF55) TaxID=988480 RepID=A0A075AYN0_ROZAC|nr:Nucleic acid-binding domain-containing protein [Rozella allomycis CSF55]|eukprot:EPZ33629.1 Nucleic acid-binding domain-containing protein [Rozella allomycis CSF55]